MLRDTRCAPVAAGDCVRGTADENAGTRANIPDGADSRRAAHELGCRGSPDPSGACGASTAVGVQPGSPVGYRSAASELAGTAENGPRMLHTAGTAWLHPRRDRPVTRWVRPRPTEKQPLHDCALPGSPAGALVLNGSCPKSSLTQSSGSSGVRGASLTVVSNRKLDRPQTPNSRSAISAHGGALCGIRY
ncbi:MAG: hypothetical protein JWO52_8125 [Gammaproteobacteria bacterium]|nr:hypothetical protein [Gammaproteobacteria bacterium]